MRFCFCASVRGVADAFDLGERGMFGRFASKAAFEQQHAGRGSGKFPGDGQARRSSSDDHEIGFECGAGIKFGKVAEFHREDYLKQRLRERRAKRISIIAPTIAFADRGTAGNIGGRWRSVALSGARKRLRTR